MQSLPLTQSLFLLTFIFSTCTTQVLSFVVIGPQHTHSHRTLLTHVYSSTHAHGAREGEEETQKTFQVNVTHQNVTTTLEINSNESILNALERNRAHDALALPALPNECRKGSCWTCSGRHQSHSNRENVILIDDGLSPSTIEKQEKRGGGDDDFVLTCSSYVVGEGVALELGVCDKVWKKVFMDDDEGEMIRLRATAKTIRLADESNLHKWAEKTEKMLDQNHS